MGGVDGAWRKTIKKCERATKVEEGTDPLSKMGIHFMGIRKVPTAEPLLAGNRRKEKAGELRIYTRY